MPSFSDDVWRYFRPASNTFWRWSDDHQAIEWRTGETIVFRTELASILDALGDHPIPLDGILLVLAACRVGSALLIPELTQRLQFKDQPMGSTLETYVSSIASSLLKLAKLPDDLRSGLEGRLAILTIVGENFQDQISPGFEQQCSNWLRQGYHADQGTHLANRDLTVSRWMHLFRRLNDGLLAINVPAIRLRLQTSLEPDELPVPVPLDLPAPSPVETNLPALLKELAQHDQYSGLVRLMQRLFSIVSIPRPVSAPADQPLGGVSDISNRGRFDRLLLSELAQDSDVLMTRVALNEALYIRQEIPPTIPPRNRLVLLDAGIRMWGLPRLYAASVALALAANQHESVTTRIFRAERKSLAPVILNSSDNFPQPQFETLATTSIADMFFDAHPDSYFEHLEVLEPDMHPGAALPAFADESSGQPADFVIVTCDEVWADPEFKQCLQLQKLPDLYAIILNRDGDLRLIHRTRQGEQPLRSAKLELDTILKGADQAKRKVVDSSKNAGLPAIFHVKPFPLKLSHKFDVRNCGRIPLPGLPEAFIAISTDRRLMLWLSRSEWARQLHANLPEGTLLWNAGELNADGMLSLVIGNLKRGRLHLIKSDLAGINTEVIELNVDGQEIQCVHAFQDVLQVVLKQQTVVAKPQTLLFSLGDGQRLDAVTPQSDFSWIGSRFYVGYQGCFALGYDGLAATWQMVLPDGLINLSEIKTVFDCEFHSAPVVLTRANEFIVTGEMKTLEFDSTYKNRAVSVRETRIGCTSPFTANYVVEEIGEKGNTVVLSDSKSATHVRNCWRINLALLNAVETQSSKEPRIPFQVRTDGNFRTRFIQMGTNQGALVLVTNKQKLTVLKMHPQQKELVLMPLAGTRADLCDLRSFKPVTLPEPFGFEVRMAEWQDGSRAWLDSRGLLHLKSNDSRIPEMTLVLQDKMISGWVADQRVWGDPGCVGQTRESVHVNEVLERGIQPFCERLR